MGGNALKNCTTRRYDADEYRSFEWHVLDKLGDLFPLCQIAAIKAYATKESFGDMDVIICTEHLPDDYIETIIDDFAPKDVFRNGNCLSFEYLEFQVDLITYPPEEFGTALDYYAYNDLGNLCGRLAHMMGLKLGHDGLSYNWRVDTYQFKNVVLLTDWDDILPVLGLDPAIYRRGFDTLEDIFKFVVSSQFFSKDIFLLENRNNTSRTRDAKRKTYMEFLDWIEVDGNVVNNYPKAENKYCWLQYLFNSIPHFRKIYYEVMTEWKEAKVIKEKFNGGLVRHITGIEGKELGDLMKFIKENSDALTSAEWILAATDAEIRSSISFWCDEFKFKNRG